MKTHVAHVLQVRHCNSRMDFTRVTTVTEDDIIGDQIDGDSMVSLLCIPASVVALGKKQLVPDKSRDNVEFSCFRGCRHLESVMFEANSAIRVFQPGAFAQSYIKSIYVPESVFVIGASCFEGCLYLESVIFPTNSRLARIEEAAFSRCAVKSLALPRSVEFIGRSCFLSVERMGCQSPLHVVSFMGPSCLLHLGRSAFFNTSIRQIEVPRHVAAISQHCFAYSLLENITFEMPSRMRRFGVGAFSNSALRTIEVPEGVEVICRSCFECCESLKVVEFRGNNLREVGARAFFGCPINVVSMPQSVALLGDHCFGCADAAYMRTAFPLDVITFVGESQLVHIGTGAFRNTRIQKLDLPDSVETIGDMCFENCVVLAELGICMMSHLKVIGVMAFARCSIEKVFIPRACEVIGESAFENCQSLSEVECAESQLRVIGRRAFAHTSIKQFVVGPHVETIGESCFECCLALKSVIFVEPSSLLAIKSKVFYKSGLCSVKIPASVKHLGASCFGDGPSAAGPAIDISFSPGSQMHEFGKRVFDYAKIRSIEIPASVKSIDYSAFFASEVDELAIDSGNQDFSAANGLLFNRQQTVLIRNMSSLAQIVIPASVEVVSKGAFVGSKSLECVLFEPGAKARVIEEEAFYACPIHHITIPDSVELIGKKCFAQCKTLRSISFGSNSCLVLIDGLAFSQCGVTSICIPASTTTLGVACFEGCQELSSVAFESGSGLVTIGDMAFASTAISEITIPPSVVRLGKSCFGRCHALQRVEFASNTTLLSIGDRAFYNSGILSISIPRSVREIGKSCFESCGALSRAIFADGIELQTLAEMLFYASPLQEFVVPESVETISRSCFGRAGKSEFRVKLSIPKGSRLKRIEACALQVCHIHHLWIPASLEQIAPTAFSSCLVDEIEVDPGNHKFRSSPHGLATESGDVIVSVCY